MLGNASRQLCTWLLSVVLFAVLSTAASDAARAQEPPAQSAAGRRYSPYEVERIRRALARVGGTIDPQPEGKRIQSIEVVAFEVFEPDEPVPQFLNWFHVTTGRDIIEREVLLRVGGRYDQRRSDETERNLRALLLFSVVVALPVRGDDDDSVRYLVVTKDLWSLRVSWDGRINKGVVDYLSLQPSERNLFGTGRQLFGTLVFGRRTYSVGAGFYEPRLAGSRTRILVNASAIVNCDTGDIEGSSGRFQYARPLYTTSTPWAYSTDITWSNSQQRLDVVGNLRGAICSARTEEELAVELPNGKTALVPNRYSYDSQTFSQSFTRSFGYRYKTNLAFGIEAERYAYAASNVSRVRAGPSDVPGELTDAERASVVGWYQGRVPRGDLRISPFFDLTAFTTNFHRDINSETLALQEDVDFRLGHIAKLRLYPALQAFGSTRDLLGVITSASYAWSVGTGYMKIAGTHTIELSSPEQTDASLVLAYRFTTPRFALGRFVYDARLTDHYRNYLNTNLALGGTGRLRGYEITATVGSNSFISNLEFRTRPIEILSTQLAAVVFHDMGDTFDRYADAKLLHGVGAGIRFLAPQLDRDVFRVDVGLPVPFDAPRGELSVIATFGQAFPVP